MNYSSLTLIILLAIDELISTSCGLSRHHHDSTLHMQKRERQERDISKEERLEHRNITNFQILDARKEIEMAYIIDSLENLGVLSASKTNCYMVHRIVREVLAPNKDQHDSTRIVVQMEFYERTTGGSSGVYNKQRNRPPDPGKYIKLLLLLFK